MNLLKHFYEFIEEDDGESMWYDISFYDLHKYQVNQLPLESRIAYLDKLRNEMDEEYFDAIHNCRLKEKHERSYTLNKKAIKNLKRYFSTNKLTIRQVLSIHKEEINKRFQKEKLKDILVDVGSKYGYTNYQSISNIWSEVNNP